MITLEFRIQTLFDGPFDVSTASVSDIHYNFMLGDVTFSVGDSDFSMHWGWVPILDFALSLKSLCQNIGNSGHERFEFTESGEWIDFVLRGNSVDLASSYVDSTATVELKNLISASESFLDAVLAEAMLVTRFDTNSYARSLFEPGP